jgi:glycosyltransferase involved in cell wall biosynthesis
MNNNPVVSISCITYNHAPYISQCLDGFLMQKTDFPIEVLIHDDASTDGTADIIREYEKKYPEIIKPIYQTENQYSKGIRISMTYNYLRANGKYIAFCEGDDYWIDPYKLQKQVDFLEKNPEYGMCCTKVKGYNQKENKFFKKTKGSNACSFPELMKHNTVVTLTVCLNRNLWERCVKEINMEDKKWIQGDYPTWLWFAYNSKIYFMEDVTGVYRVLEESMSHSHSIEKSKEFIISAIEINKYFSTLYNYHDIDIDVQKNLLMAYLAVTHGQYKQYNEYLSKIQINGLMISIKKLIGKSHFLFTLYHIYQKYCIRKYG